MPSCGVRLNNRSDLTNLSALIAGAMDMPVDEQPDRSGAEEGTPPQGHPPRSETLEAELAALEAMLPPDATAPALEAGPPGDDEQ